MKKIITLILLSLFSFNFAQNVSPEYVDGQIFVKFRTGTIKNIGHDDPNNIPLNKIAAVRELITKYGITKAYKPFYQADDDIRLTHILQLEFSNATKINELIEELASNNIIEYAEKVMLLKTHITPNEFTNAGNTSSVYLNQINAANAWNVYNSTSNGTTNITVAIVDNAIQRTHVDLTANIWTNPGEIPSNNIDDDQNGYVDDVNGWDPADGDNNTNPTNYAMDHGTHTSGCAAATNNNSIGCSSIGWNLKIIPVKCAKNTDPTTSVGYGYQGIIYAAKCKARVISCSWGGTGSPSSAAQSVIDYAWSKGCIIICSAGNDNNNVLHYPAAYNNVYAVAACSSTNVKSSFSCFGTWVDITAPGNNIYSTLPNATNNNYGQMSGTSMACPIVAGLAGLMLAKYPYMSQTNVLNCISSTAANIYTISGNSPYVTGNQLGAGRIEAYQAMLCAASYTGTPPTANFYTLTRNTCPNTNIAFVDSSTYNPQSWSWSFPGGTPATSTSSAPIVSYASPGTYNVTMTVTNTNGSSVKVRNSYITIAGPIALPLVEGFQSSPPFVPANWTTYNVWNDSLCWKLKQGVGGFTVNAAAKCAMFNDYEEDATGDRDEMRTPRYNFSNVANAKLRFDVAYKQYDVTANITPQNPYSDTLEVRLSTNCGATSSQIYIKGGQTLSSSPGTLQASIFVPTATEWRTDSINITSIAAFQPNVMAHFVNRAHYGQAMYVDNINIFLPAPTMVVASPSLGCTNTAYTFTNNTTGAAGYTWTSNPASSISAPNGTNTNITFTSPGVYSITCTANNGTVTNSIIKTITVSTQPTVALSTSTNNICSGTNVTLTASGASTYSWSTSQTANSIVVSPTTSVTYTVQGNNNNCYAVQSIVINGTLTPVVSVSSQTICASGTATLTASGASTYSWSTGYIGNPLTISPSANTVLTVYGNNGICADSKTVGITIGSSITIIPSVTTPTICAGGTVGLSATGATTYTWNPGNLSGANQTVTPSSSTTYTVGGTNAGCNGQATIAVSIISAPALVLSPNSSSVCGGGSSTISASGYATYTWNPGNLNGNSQVFTPSSTQIYTVQGKLGNCNGTQTAVVSVVNIPTVSITGGTFMCIGNSVNLTANGATTYSWASGPTTQSISVSPATNTTYVVTGANSNCTSTAAISVSVNPNPTVAISTPSNPICLGDALNLTGSGATTYTWSGGVSSQFNPVFVSPTITTNYTLTGTQNGCTNTSVLTLTVNNCGGVGLQTQTLPSNQLFIFPNPSSDVLTISYIGKKFDYVLYDNIGRLIRSEKGVADQTKIKVNEYAKGSYFIEVVSDGEKTRRKLIIE